uniref:ATP synthase mitochondrial F1 complex assembly factor 1 n=1 Tax=Alexandrium catenella TaxID=2925 RepID=A0A7S1L6U2_ALECA
MASQARVALGTAVAAAARGRRLGLRGAGHPATACLLVADAVSCGSRRTFATEGHFHEFLGSGMAGGARKLGDLAKVPLLQRESPTRVRDIWLERFRDKPTVVAGALSQEEYKALVSNATACPVFLVPVPRGSGYLNLVWQAQRDLFLFQTLESFQAGAGRIDFGVSLFTELLPTHSLALLHGELKTGLLTKEEAARVVRYTREAYMDPSRFAWVQRFNNNPREFDYQEFLSAFRPLERFHTEGS